MLASELSRTLTGRLIGDDVSLNRIAHLFCARSDELSIVVWPKDIRFAKKTNAGCLILDLATAAEYAAEMPCTMIVVDDLLSAFHALRAYLDCGMLRATPGPYACAPTAIIHKTATVGTSSIGEHTVLGPNVVIDDESVIGKNCRLGPGVVIHSDVVVGDNVIIGAHSVIGSPAFAPFGNHEIQAMPSLGSVDIQNDVHIGAQCTIDRGLIAQTRINEKTLIDNMVHLGHDVLIGKNVIIAAQTGVAGCARIGDYVTLAGQVGIAPHATVDDGARISGKSLVHGNVKKGSVWSGNPSVPHAVYLREYARLKHHAKGMN